MKQDRKKSSVKAVGDRVQKSDKKSVKGLKSQGDDMNNMKKIWVKDVSLEVVKDVSGLDFKEGSRELEFSVGARSLRIEGGDAVELRARALVHIEGDPLVLAEVSCVSLKADEEQGVLFEAIYKEVRASLQKAFALAGMNPPLPETLSVIEA